MTRVTSSSADLFRTDFDISLNGLNAEIEIAITDVTLSNIDSFGMIKLAVPMMGELSVLSNEAVVGVGPNPIRLSLSLLVKGSVADTEFDNEVEISVSLVDLYMMLWVLAQMQEISMMNFPLEDVMDLNCWLLTIVSPKLDEFGISVGDLDSGLILQNVVFAVEEARVNMKCIRCTNDAISEIANLTRTEEGVADATYVINKVLEYGSDFLMGDYIQNQIDRKLNSVKYSCPHSSEYEEDFKELVYEDMPVVAANDATSYGFLFATISVIAVVAVSAALIFFSTRFLSMSRHTSWMRTLTQDQIRELSRLEQEERTLEKDLDTRMKSLLMSREVPSFVRYSFPIVILANIALFLSGHLSLGGTVDIRGNVGEQEYNVVGFYEFSVAKSVMEMFEAKAYALAIMLAIFSGIWPYVKQLFTLFLWCSPPRWVSSKRRGSILAWLDILGKWSIIDVFVLLMTLVSFNIQIESPDLRFLPEGLYSIFMMVIPLWGLYANMLVSDFLNHLHITQSVIKFSNRLCFRLSLSRRCHPISSFTIIAKRC